MLIFIIIGGIIAGVFTTVSMLYVAETTLRTKKPMQLPGLAERYVGSNQFNCSVTGRLLDGDVMGHDEC